MRKTNPEGARGAPEEYRGLWLALFNFFIAIKFIIKLNEYLSIS